MKSLVTINDIQRASQLLKKVILETPTIESPWLSQLIQGRVFLKLENLQVTSSFKPRGAYIKILQLNEDQRKRGIIAMSAGNHAQGVAYHAQKLQIPAVIVMPTNTPAAKIEQTRNYGAEVVLAGSHLAESAGVAQELIETHGYTLIHPYDDPAIIAGQGTVGLEMLEAQPSIDTFIVPVGGGGLASGISIVAHHTDTPKKSIWCPVLFLSCYDPSTLS